MALVTTDTVETGGSTENETITIVTLTNNPITTSDSIDSSRFISGSDISTYLGTLTYANQSVWFNNHFRPVYTYEKQYNSLSDRCIYYSADEKFYANAEDRTFKVLSDGVVVVSSTSPSYRSTGYVIDVNGDGTQYLAWYKETNGVSKVVFSLNILSYNSETAYINDSYDLNFKAKIIYGRISHNTSSGDIKETYTLTSASLSDYKNVRDYCGYSTYTSNDSIFTQLLNGQTSESQSEGTYSLYFYRIDTTQESNYKISVTFKKHQQVTNTTITANKPLILGNTLKYLREDGCFTVQCTYNDGTTSTITDYDINDEDTEITDFVSIKFTIRSNDYYDTIIETNFVNYTTLIPDIKEITVANNPTEQKTGTIVSLANTTIDVTYENATYTQHLTFEEGTNVADESHFSAVFQGIDEEAITSYQFDGVTALNGDFTDTILKNFVIKYSFISTLSGLTISEKTTSFKLYDDARRTKLVPELKENIVLGNYISTTANKTRWFQVKEVWNDHTKDNYTSDFSVLNTNRIDSAISSVAFRSTIEPLIEATLTLTSDNFIIPNREDIVVYENLPQVVTNSGVVDLTKTKMIVTYKDSEVKQVLSFSKGSATQTTFDAKLNGEFSSYGFGTDEKLEGDFTSVTEISTYYSISYMNYFTGNYAEDNPSFTLVEISEILGITLVPETITQKYYVGDTFLNSSDTTEIVIRYKTYSGDSSKMRIKLNSGLDSINISPAKGTEFRYVDDSKTVTITSATNSSVTAQYTIYTTTDYSENSTTEKLTLKARYSSSKEKYYLYEEKYLLYVDSLTGGTADTEKAYGYLDNVNEKDINAQVVLYGDYTPLIDGVSNINVTFPYYVEGNADKINNCKFGVLFGNNNAKNRLFVSGNEDICNCDWHSGELSNEATDYDSSVSGNFGYFEDTSYCYYGETDNSLVAYSIISNNKLLALKDKSDKETTVYFRSPTLVTAIDGSGNAVTSIDDSTLYQEEFTLVKGNNSVGGINHQNIVNFNGDTLFLSEDKQIVGLDLEGMVGDNQRYANTRSYYIDPKLKDEDFTGAFMWSNNKYLFLVLKEKIYVTHIDTKVDSQYDWWVLNISGVTSIIEIDNEIYMAKEGRLCKFTDKYQDINAYYLSEGSSLLVISSVDDDTLTEVVTQKSIIEQFDTTNCTYTMEIKGSEPMYYSIGDQDDGEVVTSGAIPYLKISVLRSDLIVALGNPNPPTICFLQSNSDGSKTKIENSDFIPVQVKGENYYDCFRFVYANNVNKYLDLTTYLKDKTYEISTKLDGEYIIGDIDTTSKSFKLYKGNNLIDIVYGVGQSSTTHFEAIIREYENVKAYYITKPYDFGNLNYFKTIVSWTIANDSNIPSETEVAYVTNKIPMDTMKTMTKVGTETDGFDYNFFNFNKVDFTKNYVPHTYTNSRLLGMKKYIAFGFRNYNNTNSVLGRLSILYKVPTHSYGGD